MRTLMDETAEDDPNAASKENLISANVESFHSSPCLDRIKAGMASRRVSKAGSNFDTISLDSVEVEHTQEFICQKFAQLESKLEDYLECMTEEFTQDLQREQQHLILMQEQVDKQAQMIQREVTALNKKLEGETTRRSFVSSEVKGTKEALAEQLEKQSQELAILRARVAELETPIFLRSLRRMVAGLLSGCSPWTRDLLPVTRDPVACSLTGVPAQYTPVRPLNME